MRRPLVVLGALVAVSTVARAWAGLRIPSPWIAADEMVYAELGRSLWETGRLTILGEDMGFYSLVHPALIGGPLALATDGGYDAARVLQALAMSVTAVPVFFWGRRLMSERWSLGAVALTLTLPGLAYTGLLMTETVFLPAMTLAAWAAAHALARPSLQAYALLVGAFALAVLTRLQALALVPAFVLAVLVLAALERSRAPLRRAAAVSAVLVVLTGAWLAVAGIGAYEPAGSGGYDLGRVLRFVAYHAGDALLLTGLVPAAALGLLLVAEARRRTAAARSPLQAADVRAYLAVTVAVTAALVAEVGVFASKYVGRLAERDLLALAPLLFIGLCLWLDRGAPRTRLTASVAAFVAAAFVVLLPYGRLVHKGALQDAFMLVPLYELGSYDLLVGSAVAVVVLLFVVYPRALVPALALLFVTTSVLASRFVEREASAIRASFFETDPGWVDAAGAADVAYLYDGEAYWNAVWAHVFWNRSIEVVYSLAGTPRVPGPLPQVTASPQADGTLPGPGATYAVASTAFTLFGERIAENPQQGLLHRGLELWRVEPPLRISTWSIGRQGSGDIYGSARLVAYACTGGSLQLTLVAKGATESVRLLRATRPYREVTLAPEEVWNGSIPAAPVNGVCEFDLRTSGLVGSTRFEFTRE